MSAPNIVIRLAEKNTVDEISRINLIVLPVSYPPKVYSQMVSDGMSFIAYRVNPKTNKEEAVGAIGCIFKKDTIASPDSVGLCIASLSVLAAHRSKGIGGKLLEHVLEQVREKNETCVVYLQTQINNDDAVKFYEKHGFSILQKVDNFYKRLDPPHCFVLARTIQA